MRQNLPYFNRLAASNTLTTDTSLPKPIHTERHRRLREALIVDREERMIGCF
jgi:hypothetical protein